MCQVTTVALKQKDAEVISCDANGHPDVDGQRVQTHSQGEEGNEDEEGGQDDGSHVRPGTCDMMHRFRVQGGMQAFSV